MRDFDDALVGLNCQQRFPGLNKIVGEGPDVGDGAGSSTTWEFGQSEVGAQRIELRLEVGFLRMQL